MTISRYIKFAMAYMVRYQKISTLIPTVKYIQGLYMNRGFRIKSILVDNQFEPMRGAITTKKYNYIFCPRGNMFQI